MHNVPSCFFINFKNLSPKVTLLSSPYHVPIIFKVEVEIKLGTALSLPAYQENSSLRMEEFREVPFKIYVFVASKRLDAFCNVAFPIPFIWTGVSKSLVIKNEVIIDSQSFCPVEKILHTICFVMNFC